jgi:transcription elongation factor GreA
LMQQIPLTIKGHEKLQAELERLKKQERPQVIQAIAEARAHGDLKENAEYHAAKEQQSFIEGRIREVETKLGNCHVIDVTKMQNNGRVIFGATVTLLNTENDETVRYQIVGEDEADLKNSSISISSPMARALIGKNEGDEAEVQTPQGIKFYEVMKVEYL